MWTIRQLIQQYIEYNSITYSFCQFGCVEHVKQFDIGPKEYQELEVKSVHSPAQLKSLKEKALSLNFGNKSTCKLHRDIDTTYYILLGAQIPAWGLGAHLAGRERGWERGGGGRGEGWNGIRKGR